MSKNEITPINQSFLKNVSEVLAQAERMPKLLLISLWSMPTMKSAE